METIKIPRVRFEQMQEEIETLRNTVLYRRLLEFEENIQTKKFTRKDLGF